jgi:hypothetical protein
LIEVNGCLLIKWCGKEYTMIHVAVDIKKKKIVSFDVTSEGVHDDGTLIKRQVCSGPVGIGNIFDVILSPR